MARTATGWMVLSGVFVVTSFVDAEFGQLNHNVLRSIHISDDTQKGNDTVIHYGTQYQPISYNNHDQKLTWKAIGISISVPFLVATLLIYACIPELQNIHGKSLICHVLALTFLYIVVALYYFNRNIIPCNFLIIFWYFFVLASFFWLNVLCFDIFWTFSKRTVFEKERYRFLYYSMYAWGLPLLMLILALLCEQTDMIKDHSGPKFWETCVISNGKNMVYIFLFLPLLLLFSLNLYFFVATVIRIVRVQKFVDAAFNDDSSRRSKFVKVRYQFTLYLRLFSVMGISGCIWPLQMLSWATREKNWFQCISETCNCLLGMIICFLFVMNRKVLRLVVKRMRHHREPRRINVF